MIIPQLKVFWEVDQMPSIEVILVKTDWPEEDVNLVLEQITHVYPCLI